MKNICFFLIEFWILIVWVFGRIKNFTLILDFLHLIEFFTLDELSEYFLKIKHVWRALGAKKLFYIAWTRRGKFKIFIWGSFFLHFICLPRNFAPSTRTHSIREKVRIVRGTSKKVITYFGQTKKKMKIMLSLHSKQT